jgi:mono/diheme cytochrome c family protein
MKTQALVKTTVVAALFAGAFCWSAAADDATQTWDKNCAACHGKDGKGQTMMGRKLGVKDFTDPKVQASFDDALATKTIKEGKKDKDDKTLMKSFGMLSDDEIKALVANVRGFNK